MKVVIASKNQGKIEGARLALENYYNDIEIIGVSVPSNVPDQPVDLETYEGAKNRVKNLKKYCHENNIQADMFLAIESGLTNRLGEWAITNIAVIEDKNGKTSFGASPSFPVPERFVAEVKSTDFAQVMDKVFGEDKERHNHAGGIQLLTHGVVSRIDLNRLAFTVALIKFINDDKWCD